MDTLYDMIQEQAAKVTTITDPSIYGGLLPQLQAAAQRLVGEIQAVAGEVPPYEHISWRIKSEESMREKCRRKGIPETAESALRQIHDAIGIRIVCRFVDDVWLMRERILGLAGQGWDSGQSGDLAQNGGLTQSGDFVCGGERRDIDDGMRLRFSVVEEKDYIHAAKPNGYRSHHMILAIDAGESSAAISQVYYAEIQLRTIAMDSWAALEHELKYKRDVRMQEMIVAELKRVADELAACDASMQTIRKLIREG